MLDTMGVGIRSWVGDDEGAVMGKMEVLDCVGKMEVLDWGMDGLAVAIRGEGGGVISERYSI
jgi:hypothetical protein